MSARDFSYGTLGDMKPLARAARSLGGISIPAPSIAAIALGANLPSRVGDPASTLHAAIDSLGRLPLTTLLGVSRFVVTPAEGPGSSGQPPYVNACAALRTMLTPRGLLAMLLEIERAFGRERRPNGRNLARTLDLDLVLYDDMVASDDGTTPALELPHSRMHQRVFVLGPLAQLLPDMVVPGSAARGRTVRELLDALANHA